MMVVSSVPKILFPFAGETKGGSLHSALMLIMKLRDFGIDAQAVCHGPGYAFDEAVRVGAPIISLPGFGRAKENRDRSDGLRAANILSMRHVGSVLRKERPTLIHLNEKRMIRTWSVPARLLRVPLLIHWRSNYTPSWSVDLGLCMAQQVVSISQFSSEALPRWARKKNFVIYNPVNAPPGGSSIQHSRAAKRLSLGIDDDAVLVGCFTNFSVRKRPHLFLEVIQRLRSTHGKKIYGLLCGDVTPPADKRFLTMVETEDWSSRVFMPGYVHDAIAWMSACDVILAPALSEPWGRTLVEAQSLGIPVVAAADGGHLESIQNGVDGMLIASDSPDDWAHAVARLIDEEQLRAAIIENGQASAAALSLDRHASAVVDVYRKLVGSKIGFADYIEQ